MRKLVENGYEIAKYVHGTDDDGHHDEEEDESDFMLTSLVHAML